jgi:formylmethanofuran dehydrogenase subunit E
MKPEEMIEYATKFEIPPEKKYRLNIEKNPSEMIKYVTKFEIPPAFHRRLSIEKSPFVEGDKWVIKDFEMYFYNYYEGEFIPPVKITDKTSLDYYQSLEKAFDFVIQIQKKDEEKDIAYTGRCRNCGKYVGEENLKDAFGWNWCQECYDKID